MCYSALDLELSTNRSKIYMYLNKYVGAGELVQEVG